MQPQLSSEAQRKSQGQESAKCWVTKARVQDVIDLAGTELTYGETLDDLRRDRYGVPPSDDKDFSWGFYKQVKGYVHNLLRACLKKHGANKFMRDGGVECESLPD